MPAAHRVAVLLLGLGLVVGATGLAMWSVPLGLAAAGATLLALGLALAFTPAPPPEPRPAVEPATNGKSTGPPLDDIDVRTALVRHPPPGTPTGPTA